MKKLVSRKLVVTAAMLLTLPGAGRLCAADEATPDAAPATNAADSPLHLTPDERQRAGITLARPESRTLSPEVSAFGRVLDPTPYVALVAEVATAKAAATASEKELARAQKLFAAGGNASAQSVETARAAATRDRAAVASAEIRLLAGWGPKLAAVSLEQLHDTLAHGAALLRIDLLPGTEATDEPAKVRVALLGSNESYEAEVLGPAPVADAEVQGLSFLAWLRGRSLPAGASLRATLPGRGEPATVLVLPRTAVVYHEGSAWVYVLGEGDMFARRLVTLGRTVGDDVVIEAGVAADASVAITGAQQILSAELQAGGDADTGD